MADKPEFVWVIERNRLFCKGYTPYGFFQKHDCFGTDFLAVLDNAFFMERSYAETHSQYKQIIPYTIVSNTNGAACTLEEVTYPTFIYQRTPKGDEERLHHKFSIGIGGHISPEDMNPTHDPLWTFVNGASREVHEELTVLIDGDKDNYQSMPDQLCCPIGFINDDTTEVGSVHLGVVCSLLVDDACINEKDQLVGEFVFPHQLKSFPHTAVTSKTHFGYEPGEYESWSQFLVDKNEETRWLT